MRDITQKPIYVNSAYRTPEHNAEVGGSSRSRHITGEAADIVCPGVAPWDLFRLAETVSAFGGMGVYPYSQFLHVDVRDTPARWVENDPTTDGPRVRRMD